MEIFKSKPVELEEIIKECQDLIGMLSQTMNDERKLMLDYALNQCKLSGEITFLYIPGLVNYKESEGGGIKYSEYLIMFTCGGNKYKVDIEVCSRDKWSDEMLGKGVLHIFFVDSFD
jgi:hypothetical protein